MKHNIITKGIAGLAVALTMGACSSDYLDLEPITSIDSSTVTSSVQGARYGLYGVCRSMWWAESAFGVGQRFIQGEAAVGSFYGDLFSPDVFYNVWAGYGAEYFNWSYMQDGGTWIPGIAWKYYYNLVSSSNKILDHIDEAEGDANERDFIKAQLLTIRAHAFTRLVQLYTPRWEDSNNGAKYGIVLRLTDEGTTQIPLSTMKEAIDQIYADLDLALSLYKSSGKSRTKGWEPDENIAYAVYARIAATCHDWQKAKTMAANARDGYPIMTAEEYAGGFAEANQEWIWYNAPEEEAIYYWSWGAMYACNGAYVSFWGQAAGLMSYDLYKQMHDGDTRKDLYFMPDKISYTSPLYKPLTKASWWNASIIDPETMDVNGKNNKMKLAVKNFGNTRIPNGDEARWGTPYTKDKDASAEDPFLIPFGAQYKFWGEGMYSLSSFPFMRAAEFCLLEAEAAYHLGDEGAARACLNELNGKRFDSAHPYNCTESGQALMDEIMLTSRVELWGEGQVWYNYKRWNQDWERRIWVEGDVESNNIPTKFAGTFPKDKNRNWTYMVPNSETRYNRAIDINLLRQ